MAVSRTNNSQLTRRSADKQKIEQISSNADSIQKINQPGTEELTPLQRKRLDTAVMMLVNYLVSASSGT